MSGSWNALAISLGLKGELPTADYYVLAGLGHLVATPFKRRPITRRGPHTFEVNDRLIVVRYADRDELALIAGRSWRSVHYVIDDMLPIAGDCAELPDAYRQRLRGFAADVLPRILDAEPEIVAPRREILALFPEHRGALLDPAHLHIAASHDHFDALAGSASAGRPMLRAAFLGTRSHGAGLEFLAALAAEAARLALPMQLTVFLGVHASPALRDNPLVVNRKPLPWNSFRRLLQQERFHVMLAPLPDTPFNKGRSITKLMDAAAVGAVGLFSNRLPFSDRVTHEQNGLLIADDVAAWVAALRAVVVDPARSRQIAAGGAELARKLGDPALLRAFWLPRLALEGRYG